MQNRTTEKTAVYAVFFVVIRVRFIFMGQSKKIRLCDRGYVIDNSEFRC